MNKYSFVALISVFASLLIVATGCTEKIHVSSDRIVSRSSALNVGRYIRFDGRYYKYKCNVDASSIGKRVTENYYLVKNFDYAAQLALFTGNGYIGYIFAFNDSFSYNKKKYVIDANNPFNKLNVDGHIVGNVQQGNIYQMHQIENGFDEELIINIGDSFYKAYPMDSQVNYKGVKYDLLLHFYSSSGLQNDLFLSNYGSYKLYKDPYSKDRIIVNLNSNVCVDAWPIFI